MDLAALWSNLGAPRMVRVISEPPNIDGRFVAILVSGSARQLAAALLVAAGQTEELERDLSRPGRGLTDGCGEALLLARVTMAA